MSRTKGARNKAPVTVKQVAVRLTADELQALATIDPSPSAAIAVLIATIPAPDSPAKRASPKPRRKTSKPE